MNLCRTCKTLNTDGNRVLEEKVLPPKNEVEKMNTYICK